MYKVSNENLGVYVSEVDEDYGNPDTSDFTDFFGVPKKKEGARKLKEYEKDEIAEMCKTMPVNQVCVIKKVHYHTVKMIMKNRGLKVLSRKKSLPVGD